jgi:hypothetical protein
MGRIPADWALNLTEQISQYLTCLFRTKLNNLSTHTCGLPGPQLTAQTAAECHQIADVLVAAYRNKGDSFLFCLPPYLNILTIVCVPWDAVRYGDRLNVRMSGRDDSAEAVLSKRFGPVTPDTQLYKDPFILVDEHGIILGWYLPQLLSVQRQVRPVRTFF